MDNNRGVTLTEVLIAGSMIGILVVAMGFYYQGWMGSYRMESQVKEMHADLMTARMKAMHRNKIHFIVVDYNSYQVYEDTDESGGTSPSAADIAWWPQPKPLRYPSLWKGTVVMDRRGFVSNNIAFLGATVRFNNDLDGDGVPDISSDYDCIVLFLTRVNIGKWSGDRCAAL